MQRRISLMAKFVYVYRGLGANESGCDELFKSLERHLSSEKYKIEFISPDDIISALKLKTAAVVCFGGGFTSGFAKALGDTGLANLKAYVHNGGAYLGFGAGGYFGCDYIEFDIGGPLEKRSERDVRFFPGIGRGPVYPGFQYGTTKGVHAVPVIFQSQSLSVTFHAYIDGGGVFIPSETPKPGSEVINVTPIAMFQELDGNPAAIVKTDLKNGGKAVLSGVHLEFDTLLKTNSDSNLAELINDFSKSEQNKIEAFKFLLTYVGLDVNC